MIPVDLHTHICRSSFEAIYAGAREIKLELLGISEHIYQFAEARALYPDFFLEGEVYGFAQYDRTLRAAPDGPALRRGLELDFIPGFTERCWELAAHRDWDYVIGALHEIDGWDIHDKRALTRDQSQELWRHYLGLQAQWLRRGHCDILGHPVRMAVTLTDFPPDIGERLDDLVACAGACGAAVELNARDLRISKALVELLAHSCARHRVRVTAGSDAHFPEDIARGFDDLERLMRAVGIGEYCSFRGRAPQRHTF